MCVLSRAATGRCSLWQHLYLQWFHTVLIMNRPICAAWLSQAIFKPLFIQPRLTEHSYVFFPDMAELHTRAVSQLHTWMLSIVTSGLYTEPLNSFTGATGAFTRTQLLYFFSNGEKISIQLCLLNLIKLLRLGSLTSKQHFNTTMTKQKKHILRGWLNLKFRLNPPENPVKHWKAKEKPPEVPIYLYLIIIII